MHFNCNDTTLNLFRNSFHFYNPEEGSLPLSGDWILELYYNYDILDGWGSVGDEFIHWKDITEWLQGMENVERGKTEHFEMTLFIDEQNESYVIKRLEREARCGKIERAQPNLYRYTADVFDTNELTTWIKTFIGRIVSINGDNQKVVGLFRDDINKMAAMYGITLADKKPEVGK